MNTILENINQPEHTVHGFWYISRNLIQELNPDRERSTLKVDPAENFIKYIGPVAYQRQAGLIEYRQVEIPVPIDRESI